MIITIHDCRIAKEWFCVEGSKLLFKQHGLDYKDFLKNGIDSRILEELDDFNCNEIIRIKKERLL